MNTSEMQFAPVALFAYMRPEHLRITVQSLQENPEASRTHLTVFCDAAKKPEHLQGVEAVRAFADSIDGFASVTVHKRQSNLGLAASIIEGVSLLISRFGRVIVIEDDLLLSRHFLRYMNDALEIYACENSVASIHGYSYPVSIPLPEIFFLRGADCWGWATWDRAWAQLNTNGSELLKLLKAQNLTYEFDFDGNYPYTRMLRDQIQGRNDSWAVRWHASCYLKGMLTLYPGRSLVHNIGNDASGTHCAETVEFFQSVATAPINVARIKLEVSQESRAAFIIFFRSNRAMFAVRVVRRLRRLIMGRP